MAAIANAIERAVGTRLTELPMSPPKVRAAIDARGHEQKEGEADNARADCVEVAAQSQDPLRKSPFTLAKESSLRLDSELLDQRQPVFGIGH
jgi:hypothetical protein